MSEKKSISRCEDCEYYVYDEDWEEYVCDVSLDQDEMANFMAGDTGRCPYYRQYDEYQVVRKQN